MFDANHPTMTFLFLAVPLLATFAGQRLFLHLINPNVGIYVGGHHVYHFYVGVVMAIPAGFILAFRPEWPWVRMCSLAAFGSGSAMVLDELVFLMVTDRQTASYLKPLSFWSAVVLEALALTALVLLYALS